MIDKMIDEMKDYQLYAIRNAIMGIDVAKHCIKIAEKYKSQEQRWISVDERLPKECGEYLCVTQFYNKYSIRICGFAEDAYELDKYDFEKYKGKKKALFYGYDSEYGHYEEDSVIAWMSLPEYHFDETDKKVGE